MSGELFRTISVDTECELEEKRSTFIAAVRRVSTAAEAEAFVKERKKLHPSARHTVFAYLLRDGSKRYGDDSEPQGTAGLPTLAAIERRGVSDVCIATTRYFGGILLGAGGLTRAYGGAANLALDAAGVAEFIPYTDVILELSYADHQRLVQELPRLGARERSVAYTDVVTLVVGLPAAEAAGFAARVVDMTAGRAAPVQGQTYLDTKPQ
ncbi:MAG: YigZ family protein [Clostridia bacterium]|nr:YigZ family protein [Clostridia bacterium]